jgi:hypothetical protein
MASLSRIKSMQHSSRMPGLDEAQTNRVISGNNRCGSGFALEFLTYFYGPRIQGHGGKVFSELSEPRLVRLSRGG